MKHASSRELFDYWNERRGPRLAPQRTDIEPGAIRGILADTFMLDACGPDHIVRLAGTRLCALFARELKGESFAGLWRTVDQASLAELLTVVVEEKLGVVASVTGATASDALLPVKLELVLLPLAHRADVNTHVLGSLAPLAAPYWLGAKAMGSLELGMFRHVGGWGDMDPPRFHAVPGRMRGGLIVYDGGLAE
ncbi:PAS domain-containing protein [Pseudorhodoplanes sp.]|jgi:hypothetical protein|uniref:PAS domain-containing protein n=1 Tax=Pseudorhodoplanes sp. TaxID=1934341 RepID=UPI002CFADD23|nr:PAS domain-containing protein [Pseudorhodoplanes sp.]HWV40116.1 PAS domain-containing protein [Pseudorhodoplanes sp.]